MEKKFLVDDYEKWIKTYLEYISLRQPRHTRSESWDAELQVSRMPASSILARIWGRQRVRIEEEPKEEKKEKNKFPNSK